MIDWRESLSRKARGLPCRLGSRLPRGTTGQPVAWFAACHGWFDWRRTALYDALLDELDDDPASRVEEASIEELVEDVAIDFDDAEVEDLAHVVPEIGAELELDLDVNVDGLLEGVEEDETWSDDPVRMYLTQMGEIPLLSRQEEVTLARQIELTRRGSAAGSSSAIT